MVIYGADVDQLRRRQQHPRRVARPVNALRASLARTGRVGKAGFDKLAPATAVSRCHFASPGKRRTWK